jgi:hypothetical protein
VATQFSGAVDPAAYADAYMLWVDTATGNVKRRNAANSAWDVVGRIVPTVTEDASGNVGIGTASPDAKLEVIGNYKQKFADGNAQGFTVSINGATDDVILSNFYNAAMRFETNNTERMRIDSSGNLLVGTTDNSGNRHRFLKTNSGGYSVQIVNESTNNTSSALELNVTYSGNTSGYFIRAGDQFIYRFQVFTNGDVTNSNNSYGAISDVKLKENIVDATPKLEKLKQVRVVNYNLIGDEKKQLGVIAQELEQIFPGMVEETADKDKDGKDLGTTTKSIKYSVFVPMLIKAIQEQQALIQDLTTRLTALEGN